MRDRGGAVPITTTLASGMKPSRWGITASSVADESALTIRSGCVVCGLLSPAVQVCLIWPASGAPDGPGDEDFFWPVDNPGLSTGWRCTLTTGHGTGGERLRAGAQHGGHGFAGQA